MRKRAAIVSAGVLLMCLAAGPMAFASGADEQGETDGAIDPSGQSGDRQTTAGFLGIDVVDGLHLTGTPIKIDRDTYRLTIFGWVERPLEMSFDEVISLPATRLTADLVCPGFFRDTGEWTGVPVRDLLARASVREGAAKVVFRSADGSYEQSLPLQKAMSEGILISYRFNGKEFDPRNGFPLRLVAKGEPGSVWVKWLGEIEVTGS